MEILTAAIAGFFGAVLRYGVYCATKPWHTDIFPTGTFLINMAGSFLISFLMYLNIDRLKIKNSIKQSIISGFVGSFTTFSTVMLELVNLSSTNNLGVLIIYLVLSMILGLLFLRLGFIAARKLSSKSGGEGA